MKLTEMEPLKYYKLVGVPSSTLYVIDESGSTMTLIDKWDFVLTYSVPAAISYFPFEFEEAFGEEGTPSSCKCDSHDLARHGCMCGHIVRWEERNR